MRKLHTERKCCVERKVILDESHFKVTLGRSGIIEPKGKVKEKKRDKIKTFTFTNGAVERRKLDLCLHDIVYDDTKMYLWLSSNCDI